MRKALIGSMIILMLSIIYTPTSVHAAAVPTPVIKAGAKAIKQELKVIMGGAAVKSGVKVADKPALARAEEAWFSRLAQDEIDTLETALQTSVPALNKPGWLKAAVPVALMLSGADLFLEFSNLVNQNEPLTRNTDTTYSGDIIYAFGNYSIELTRLDTTKKKGYYSLKKNNVVLNSEVTNIDTSLQYYRQEVFMEMSPYPSNPSLQTTIGIKTKTYYFTNPYSIPPGTIEITQFPVWSTVVDNSTLGTSTGSKYVSYYETPSRYSYTPIPYETYPNPDPTKSGEVVYVYLPDPSVNSDVDQAILNNKATVQEAASPDPVVEPEPSPSIEPSIEPSPEPSTEPGTETGTDTNAGLFDWLKNAWADLMDWLHSFWNTFRNMLTDLFVPSAGVDTSPIKNVWANKFPAISRITTALGGLTTLNYDQTPPVWKVTLMGKQYVIIDLNQTPSSWMAMARNFMRIMIWSGLLFMILRELRPKPQIG